MTKARIPEDIRPSDKWIPYYFVIFFLIIMIVDGFMVTTAIRTQTGVVVEKSYEKGLAYDRILDDAAKQDGMRVKASYTYNNGEVRWHLLNAEGKPLDKATVESSFFRVIQDGSDFHLKFKNVGAGEYLATAKFPFRGEWIMKMEAKWQTPQSKNQSYKTSARLLIP